MPRSIDEWKIGDPMINANDYWPDPDYTPEDPEKAELVLKLASKITDRYLKKFTKTLNYGDPEFWMLDMVLNKEQVKFLLNMKLRTPYSIPELAEMNDMSVSDTTEMVEELRWIGIIEQNRSKDPDHHKQYELPIFVPGSAEFMMMQDGMTDKYPQLATFFNLMTQLPLAGITQMVPEGGSGIGMHTIPVEKAIEAEEQSVPVEHLSRWIDMYDKFGISECSCRKQQAMRGEGSGQIRGDYCIGMGDMAEYMDDRGIGHYITKEEVYEILERAERHGYVHQITNIDGENKIVAICNCAAGVCNALRTSQLFNTPNLSASAYRAEVEKEKCVACGKCVEVCPVGAAKLGQKLCTKDGPIKYPKSELPDKKNWPATKWNYNYREDAKIHCYETGTAPCKTACPAHLAIQGYVQMAKEGRYDDALRLIKQDNPFPAVCGDICNRRCEDACTRGTVDQPIAIDEIKKFIARRDVNAETRFVPLCEKHDGGMWGDEFKMAVIGAGPAGMTAAYFLRKDGYPVTVFDREPAPGGMMLHGIPNFRLEKDVVNAEIDVLREMGVEFRCGVEVGKDVTIQQLREEGYKAFYIAIGLQSGGKMGIPGEDAKGVMAGIDFMRDVNLRDKKSLKGDVVVIGGGNIGADVARTAIRCGAKSVKLYCLESYDEMPMGPEDRHECEEEGIEIHAGWGQTEIVTKSGKCAGIKFRKCLSVKNEEGRFDPKFDDNDTEEAACSTVLFCIGQKPDWGGLLEGTKVELTKRGTVVADPVTLQTAEPDIFAGGDVLTGQKFVIDAVGIGHAVADSMNRFVHPGNSMTVARDRREFIELNKDEALIELGWDKTPRQRPVRNPELFKTFSNDNGVLTEEQVKAEANRCLSCGATEVDENRCIGCGLCTTRCEFDAIHLHRTHPAASTMCKAEEKILPVAKYAAQRAGKIVINKIIKK
ncbi:MAG: FAD-dependent oxidoreductase [Mogibacterium sp.]|nr:FAD-dependent oxidoreductase [Mogibacterium sp.]